MVCFLPGLPFTYQNVERPSMRSKRRGSRMMRLKPVAFAIMSLVRIGQENKEGVARCSSSKGSVALAMSLAGMNVFAKDNGNGTDCVLKALQSPLCSPSSITHYSTKFKISAQEYDGVCFSAISFYTRP